MPRRRDDRPRVLGPTWCKDKASWRATVLQPQADEPGHRRTYRYFGDEKEANEWIEETRAKLVRLSGTTFADALDAYEVALTERGNLASSVHETMRRIRLFFAGVMSMQVARLRQEKAAELYAAFREGKSVDYHRNSLSNARGFMGWCMEERGWITENVLTKVKGTGRKKRGKPQFTGDEASRWFAFVVEKAARRGSDIERRDSDPAIGLLMLLTMALRQGDVIKRQVRDVDLNITVLRVSGGKTDKSNRPRKITEALRPLLKQVIHDREAHDWLFPTTGTKSGAHTKHWLRKAQKRFCAAAGVPYIPPHGLKGTAGSILAETGELSDKIADHLSHTNKSMTERHYIAPGIVDGVQAERAFAVISGGRR